MWVSWMVVVLVRIGLRVVRDAQIKRWQTPTFDLHDHATVQLRDVSFISDNGSVV